MNSNLWLNKRNVHVFTYIYNEFNKFLTNNALSSLYMHCHDILCIAWILMSIQLCSNIHPSLSIWIIWHNTFQINLHRFEIHIRYPKVCRSIQILVSVKMQKYKNHQKNLCNKEQKLNLEKLSNTAVMYINHEDVCI